MSGSHTAAQHAPGEDAKLTLHYCVHSLETTGRRDRLGRMAPGHLPQPALYERKSLFTRCHGRYALALRSAPNPRFSPFLTDPSSESLARCGSDGSTLTVDAFHLELAIALNRSTRRGSRHC